MAARKAGVVTINLSAGTAQFITDMDRAKARVRDFGSSGAKGFRELGEAGVSQTAATRAGLKALEGQFFNNTRAADKFLGEYCRSWSASPESIPGIRRSGVRRRPRGNRREDLRVL